MTSDQLCLLAPNDQVHLETWPDGCSAWTVRSVMDTPSLGRVVEAYPKWTGGGAPTLYAGAHDLERYHLATDCERRRQERQEEAERRRQAS